MTILAHGQRAGHATNPSGVGAANPSYVFAGDTSLLTVAVTPGTNPTSTGLAVTADLTAIGGPAAQPFFDNATNGDVTAGDLVFSCLATVSLASTGGTKLLPASITDSFPRTATATIALEVVAPPTPSTTLVISRVYGGGGNAGATYKNDFIELYNLGATPVTISGWSVQYASSTGTSWQVTPLTGTIPPGQYYLVQEAAGAGGTTTCRLPTRSARSPWPPARQGGAGLEHDGALGRLPGSAAIVDFVGYGSANCSETAPTPVLGNTTAVCATATASSTPTTTSPTSRSARPTPRNSGGRPPGGIGAASAGIGLDR